MFEKYDSPLVAWTFLSNQLPRFIGEPRFFRDPRVLNVLPVEVFAVASIHGLEDVARAALRWSTRCGVTSDGWKAKAGLTSIAYKPYYSSDQEESSKWRATGIADLPLDLLSRMSPAIVSQFSRLHGKVWMTKEYSCDKAADEFKVGLFATSKKFGCR